MPPFSRILTTLLILLPLSTTAFAEQLPPQESEPHLTKQAPTTSPHILSVTISPAHLILPIFEVTAEYKIIPQLGVALIGGYGSITVESALKNEFTFSTWELGAQARYYALGDFTHGLQLGIEGLYTNVADETFTDGFSTVSAKGSSFSVGPFAGYKIITNIGFTFEAQAGIYAAFLTAKANHAPTNTSDEEKGTDFGPILNVNVGWSL